MKFLLLFLFVGISHAFSQNSEFTDPFYEKIMRGEKVVLNKTVASYNASISKLTNNLDEGSGLKLDLKNPYKIYFTSNGNLVQIRINSNKIREDIIIPFKAIYKVKNSNSIEYAFVGTTGCDASYIIPTNGENHTFSMKIKDENGNGWYFYGIISKFEQL